MANTKRILIGCGLGCAGLLVLAIIIAVSFGVWISRPGELLEPEQLLGQDTTAYVEWTLRLEDPGTEGFVELFIDTLNRMQAKQDSPLPPWLRRRLASQQRKSTENDIRELFPVVAAWTLHPDRETADDVHLLSLSVESFGNRIVFLDWILGFVMSRSPDARVHRYQDEKIYQVGDENVAFFIRGNDGFFTSDLRTAEQAVDRLRRPIETDRSATPLEQVFDATSSQPLRGALVNARGELGRLWRELAAADDGDADAPWHEVRAVSLAGGLEPDGTFRANLDFLGPGADWASEHAARLARALESGFSRSAVPLTFHGRAEGDRVRVEILAEDLVRSIGEMADD